jgi:hypothetical protein
METRTRCVVSTYAFAARQRSAPNIAEEMVSALLRDDARARDWPMQGREQQGESCRCRESPASVGELDCRCGQATTTESDETRTTARSSKRSCLGPAEGKQRRAGPGGGGTYRCSLAAKHEHRAVASTQSSLVPSSSDAGVGGGGCSATRATARCACKSPRIGLPASASAAASTAAKHAFGRSVPALGRPEIRTSRDSRIGGLPRSLGAWVAIDSPRG